MDQTYKALINSFPNLDIKRNFTLAPLTTIKIGGPADIFVQTKTNLQLIDLLKFIKKHTRKWLSTWRSEQFLSAQSSDFSRQRDEGVSTTKIRSQAINDIPVTILGNGSNVLISDSGIRGIVIKNLDQSLKFTKPNLIIASAGAILSDLINFSFNSGLVGLENFAYIPASIGGATYSNIHGFDKSNLNQYIKSITIFNVKTQKESTILVSKLNWDYDYSQFQDWPHLVIISVVFKLKTGNVELAKQKYKNIITKKSTTQPLNSIGCAFKNPPDDSAGRIIDQELGLKGANIGGAQISPIHSNFIVNTGKATAKDYLNLVKLVQRKAKSKLNLDLVMEIKLLGKFE